MSFVGEEAEAQSMPRASIFDARDLVELVILEPRDISPVGRDWRDGRAQVDDEQLGSAPCIWRNNGRL